VGWLVVNRQFLRFVIVGLVATAGNLTAVWALRFVAPFSVALIAGVAVGFCLSFSFNKVFTFKSKAWSGTKAEALRFTMVYTVGAAAYWMLAMIMANFVLGGLFSAGNAEHLATLIGCAGMMVVTYVGHSLFTFKARTFASEPSGIQPQGLQLVSSNPSRTSPMGIDAGHTPLSQGAYPRPESSSAAA